MKLLVVEDETKILELLKGHFERPGYEVKGTETGEEALALLKSFQPDVMLLDLWLKGSTPGMGVLKEASRVAPKTKVVIVTGFDESLAPEAFQLGAVAFLKKPVQLEELQELLARIQQPSEELSP